MTQGAATERLFSYGSLRDENVQRAVFGRLLAGTPDAITHYRLVPIRVSDPRTIELSGTPDHKILERTASGSDEIAGTVLHVTPQELLLADAYEPPGYTRVLAPLRSGAKAWVYVRA